MVQLTEAQRNTLKKMPSHHIMAQLDTGAAMVVSERVYQEWLVVDTDGSVYAFRRYLSILGQCWERASNRFAACL